MNTKHSLFKVKGMNEPLLILLFPWESRVHGKDSGKLKQADFTLPWSQITQLPLPTVCPPLVGFQWPQKFMDSDRTVSTIMTATLWTACPYVGIRQCYVLAVWPLWVCFTISLLLQWPFQFRELVFCFWVLVNSLAPFHNRICLTSSYV